MTCIESDRQDADDSPLVSVIMTVYDPNPLYLDKAVHSVLAQSLANFELIVIEDPSTRSGQCFLGNLDDSRVRYVLNPCRTSLVAQKNLGLTLSRAPLVAFMDADDIAHPSRLAKQVDYLNSHPDIEVLGSQVATINADGHSTGHRNFPIHHNSIVRALERFVPFCHPSVMLRRHTLVTAGGYQFQDYRAAEDYELWSRMAKAGVRFGNHPETLLSYRIHSEQIKCKHVRETLKGILRVKDLYWRQEVSLASRSQRLLETWLLALPNGLLFQLVIFFLYHVKLTRISRFFKPRAFISSPKSDPWNVNIFSSSVLRVQALRCFKWRSIVTRGS